MLKWNSEFRTITIEDDGKLSMRDTKGTFAPFLVYYHDLKAIEVFLPENDEDLAYVLFKSEFEHKDLTDFSRAANYRNCYIETAKTLLPKLDELKTISGDVSITRTTYKKEEVIIEEKKSNKTAIIAAVVAIAVIAAVLLTK